MIGVAGPGVGASSPATSVLGSSSAMISPHRLLFAAADELVERDAVDLDDLETDAGDVTVGTAHAAADAFDEDLVVLVDEVYRAVAHRERGDLAAVLDQ